jgi:hypothetical protein
VLAGALLVNAVPHAVTGLAGKRFPTPLRGRDSGPAANLAWSAVNLAAGAALLVTGRRRTDHATASHRLAAVGTGAVVMVSFGTVHELAKRLRARRPYATPPAGGRAR